MRKRIYIFTGVLTVVFVLATFFVFKVFGSENTIYVTDCTPYNVKIEKGEKENTVDIYWESREKCSGYLLYGSEMKDLGMVGVDLENEVESRQHYVNIQNLVSTKRYYFSIISNGMSYGKDGLPLQFSIISL
ncbi:MAG: hypothetical protein UR61_C0003G0005 [candidate division WS6 bacterium GW2011_GWE1_34_7]|uniref:Purple acid phosphatase N-terminal domain-containing protein n=1 Tax=candidate division WS6 bacterium GW2011_GWE1_34_7 TaxID=1619093 RepID=A0A0G0EFQ4_9BACT|nr:MAG: hypothetical protein UR61_C0003G0005 [candidate division WS6 bacterium GW2011_GWE1_34_7]